MAEQITVIHMWNITQTQKEQISQAFLLKDIIEQENSDTEKCETRFHFVKQMTKSLFLHICTDVHMLLCIYILDDYYMSMVEKYEGYMEYKLGY